MAHVTLRIVEDAERAAAVRAEELDAALRAKPDLTLVGSTGRTPVATYAKLGELGTDLRAMQLRMLDSYVPSPSRGFSGSDHPASFTRYVHEKILAPLEEAKRPRDWVVPPEDVSSCEEIMRALEEQPDAWQRVRHPITGEEGSEFAILETATDCLARIRTTCLAYERLVAQNEIDIVMTGLGPLPYPHLAFNCGPYTRPDAQTHLALLDDATRRANCEAFGGDMDDVPPFALTCGASTLAHAKHTWITATGSHKSTAVAHALSDPRLENDFELKSSIAFVLRAARVDFVLDAEAAEDLLADGGFEGLGKRFSEAGHRLEARRA